MTAERLAEVKRLLDNFPQAGVAHVVALVQLETTRMLVAAHTYASRDTDDRVEGVEQHRKVLAELGVMTRLSVANPGPLNLWGYCGAVERAKRAKEAK